VNEKKKSKGFIIVGPETGEREGERECLRLTPDGAEEGTLTPFNPEKVREGSRIVAGQRRGPIMKVELMTDPIRSPEGAPRAEPAKTKGPAKVTTDDYRDGWNLIWGKRKVAQA
jgi:hypothetical protein